MNSDKMVIGLKGKDELREYLAKKAPGDRCRLEVEVFIDEITPDQAVFSIETADMEDMEDEAATPEPASNGEHAPMEAMMGKSKGPAAVMAVYGGKKP